MPGFKYPRNHQAQTGARAGMQNRKEEPGVRESKNLE